MIDGDELERQGFARGLRYGILEQTRERQRRHAPAHGAQEGAPRRTEVPHCVLRIVKVGLAMYAKIVLMRSPEAALPCVFQNFTKSSSLICTSLSLRPDEARKIFRAKHSRTVALSANALASSLLSAK